MSERRNVARGVKTGQVVIERGRDVPGPDVVR